MKKPKTSVRKDLSPEITATYDGERFGLVQKLSDGYRNDVIVLSLREALYLYEFIGEQIRGG